MINQKPQFAIILSKFSTKFRKVLDFVYWYGKAVQNLVMEPLQHSSIQHSKNGDFQTDIFNSLIGYQASLNHAPSFHQCRNDDSVRPILIRYQLKPRSFSSLNGRINVHFDEYWELNKLYVFWDGHEKRLPILWLSDAYSSNSVRTTCGLWSWQESSACPMICQDIFQAKHLYLAGRITCTEIPTGASLQVEVCLPRATQRDSAIWTNRCMGSWAL